MSQPFNCGPSCCTTPLLVQIPGSPGSTGATGPQGPQGATGPQGPAGASATTATFSAYASSAAYTMTASQALLNITPTPPSIIITQPGTYLLYGRARFDGVGATLTTQTLTTKLRCVNNTIADVANTQRVFDFVPCTTTSGTMAEVVFPPVTYVAANGDNIQAFGALSGATGAGTITCVECDIIAVQIPLGSVQIGGLSGSGTPQSVVSASPGTTYVDTATGNFWVKLTGTGNTGWFQLLGN